MFRIYTFVLLLVGWFFSLSEDYAKKNTYQISIWGIATVLLINIHEGAKQIIFTVNQAEKKTVGDETESSKPLQSHSMVTSSAVLCIWDCSAPVISLQPFEQVTKHREEHICPANNCNVTHQGYLQSNSNTTLNTTHPRR